MTRINIFNSQLALIENQKLRNLVEKVLEAAPDYFYTMPASTTGKYHPEYSLGEGGLVRHTKAAVKIADCLLGLEMYSKLKVFKDQIIAALILHDSVKKGRDGSQWTSITHPLDAADLFIEVANKEQLIKTEDVELIADMIKSHMGQWNTDRNGCEVLPKPETPAQKFVHQCDYLASRKFITVEELN